MAITLAKVSGSWVEVYDGNRRLYSKPVNTNKGDALIGFTGFSVSIKEGSWIVTFDEKGQRISSHLV
ncbi:hypothetical protein UPTC15744_00352 [Campylobacter lari]|uniref:hypothetical protein n=1 Tax=Campylobacter lari TaxID=201 RepID=UPI0021525B68|nr:hypothetical protein [Campylobacter lari]MCR6535990.1 hypothetical protein [Campylobacter lari]